MMSVHFLPIPTIHNRRGLYALLLLLSVSLPGTFAFSIPTGPATLSIRGTSSISLPSLHAVPGPPSTSSSSSSSHDANNASNDNNTKNNSDHNDESKVDYTMDISYEGRTCTTTIRPGESILSALERTGAADQLALPSLPSDCRRGNCLTCVGRHAADSDASQLQRGDDGLSPYMSDQAQKRGYILTCSSFVQGDGVKLHIGRNQQAWDELYKDRFEEEPTQQAGRAAMAKVIRMNAERNVEEWAQETEEILRKSTE